MPTHIQIDSFVLQPDRREDTDASGIKTYQSTYIGPASLFPGFQVGQIDPASGASITEVQASIIEGDLCQVTVTAKGASSEVSQEQPQITRTVELNRQYFGIVVPGYGYVQQFGAWIMVPTVRVSAVMRGGGYSPGSIGGGGGPAPSHESVHKLRVKNLGSGGGPGKLVEVVVRIRPGQWYCASASHRSYGDVIEAEEVWEVEYGASYEVRGDHYV